MLRKAYFVVSALVLLVAGLSCSQTTKLDQDASLQTASQIESPVKNHLVAQWLFNGDMIDSSGNGYDASNNGACFVGDRFGVSNNAVWFDGATMSIEADIPAYVFKGDFTLCFWAKIDHFGNVYATMVSSRNYNFLFQALGEGIGDGKFQCPEFYFYDDITQAHIGKTTSQYQMQAGTWTFLTAVRKADKSYLIVNATDKVGPVIADPSEFMRTIDHLFFAKTEFGRAPEYFPGALDDVRLYDRALNDNEIMELYVREKDINNVKE